MLPVSDTIAAISTPLFPGGIGVIRISGISAFKYAESVFSGKIRPTESPSHVAHFGLIINPDDNTPIDEALCTVMRGPNSYTGEDVVELSLHGSPLLLRQTLGYLYSQGVRQAEPGEFTFRAYINGRLSLTQAEAVQQLISAKSDAGLRNAFLQLRGALQKHISGLRRTLQELIAHFEAEIEYPEEGLIFLSSDEAISKLTRLTHETRELSESYKLGRRIEDGINVVICGPPNSGKSTLLNRLMNEDKAIVHDTPGTTRDIIEGSISLRGATIKLVDTAGIRKAPESVEEEGIRRSKKALQSADCVLWVESIIQGKKSDDMLFNSIQLSIEEADNKPLLLQIRNKIDLFDSNDKKTEHSNSDGELFISALSGEGVEKLTAEIEYLLDSLDISSHEGKIVTSSRQQQLFGAVSGFLQNATDAVTAGISLEYISVDLNAALNSLNEVIGEQPDENIYDILFSSFCLGK